MHDLSWTVEPTNVAGLSEACLRDNLVALSMRSPTLVQRLLHPVESSHIQLQTTSSGAPTARLARGAVLLHSLVNPLREASDAAEHLRVAENRPIVCLGLGLGYYIEAALRKTNPCRTVFAYERDPWLLRLTLMRCSYARDILSGRVRFLLGTDVQVIREVGRSPFFWPHPVLGALYSEETRFLTSAEEGRSPGRRVMVASGGLFVADVVDLFHQVGLDVLTWNPERVSLKETVHQLHAFAPDLVFSANFRRGLPGICEAEGIPHIVWEIDPSIERLEPGGSRYEHTWIFTYRKANVEQYRQAGFRHVEYLPLAAHPGRRYPMVLSHAERERYGCDISFVGSSMAAQAVELADLYGKLTDGLAAAGGSGRDCLDYRRISEVALEQQELSPDCYVVEDVFKRFLKDGSWVVRDSEGRLIDLSVCVGEASAWRRRLRILSAVKSFDVKVWGDGAWGSSLPREIQYCGEAGHFQGITRIYNASRINLDINRIYQPDIVTMRIFDVMACRGFVLADYSEDLAELFDLGTEVIAYKSSSELKILVEHFLHNETEREQIASAGYERVLKDHTIAIRVQHMLEAISGVVS